MDCVGSTGSVVFNTGKKAYQGYLYGNDRLSGHIGGYGIFLGQANIFDTVAGGVVNDIKKRHKEIQE